MTKVGFLEIYFLGFVVADDNSEESHLIDVVLSPYYFHCCDLIESTRRKHNRKLQGQGIGTRDCRHDNKPNPLQDLSFLTLMDH